jgi:esterase/lipase superfamily enzyme
MGTVTVFYATDRKLTASTDPKKRYLAQRSEELTYGECEVSIPATHQEGELESPSYWKFWKFDFVEDPKKHIVLLNVTPASPDQYFAKVSQRIESSQDKKAFVFIHGYNVTFEDAARRTAQITHDLKFDGAPIFYSWPSRGKSMEYTIDETNVDWTRPHLKGFIADVLARTSAQRIFLVAHSMGNRALVQAFNDIVTENPAARARIAEVILAAPDIDADVFKRDIAPRMIGTGDNRTPVTLYASQRDEALTASRRFHGYARAGDIGHALILMEGIDTIDASNVDSSLLGHSYIGGSRSVLDDMYTLISMRARACDRAGLRAVPAAVGKHCVFNP